jgi:hypothetical protein
MSSHGRNQETEDPVSEDIPHHVPGVGDLDLEIDVFPDSVVENCQDTAIRGVYERVIGIIRCRNAACKHLTEKSAINSVAQLLIPNRH